MTRSRLDRISILLMEEIITSAILTKTTTSLSHYTASDITDRAKQYIADHPEEVRSHLEKVIKTVLKKAYPTLKSESTQ